MSSSSSFGPAAFLEQAAFRGRNDDGNETTATWKAAINTDWTQEADTLFRVRFLVKELNGVGISNVQLQLQYQHGGSQAPWVNAKDSRVIDPEATANYAKDSDATQQLGSGTFVADNNGMIHTVAFTTRTLTWAGTDELEVEYTVKIDSAQVSQSDTICMRVVQG